MKTLALAILFVCATVGSAVASTEPDPGPDPGMTSPDRAAPVSAIDAPASCELSEIPVAVAAPRETLGEVAVEVAGLGSSSDPSKADLFAPAPDPATPDRPPVDVAKSANLSFDPGPETSGDPETFESTCGGEVAASRASEDVLADV